MKIFILLLMTTSLLGCTLKVEHGSERRKSPVEQGPGGVIKQGENVADLMWAEDTKRGVICYRFVGREGMSCLRKTDLQ